MEGPENIPLEAGGGLPPPEAFEEGSGEGPPLMLVWMLRMVALRGAHYVYQYLYFHSIWTGFIHLRVRVYAVYACNTYSDYTYIHTCYCYCIIINVHMYMSVGIWIHKVLDLCLAILCWLGVFIGTPESGQGEQWRAEPVGQREDKARKLHGWDMVGHLDLNSKMDDMTDMTHVSGHSLGPWTHIATGWYWGVDVARMGCLYNLL